MTTTHSNIAPGDITTGTIRCTVTSSTDTITDGTITRICSVNNSQCYILVVVIIDSQAINITDNDNRIDIADNRIEYNDKDSYLKIMELFESTKKEAA